MIKGLSKKAIIIKCDKESVFEQAILFIKDNDNAYEYEQDIITAANNIVGINDNKHKKKDKVKFIIHRSIYYVIGIISGIFMVLFYITLNK